MIDSMTPGAPRNMADPDYLAERQWGAAISRWFEHDHDGSAVAALVMDNSVPIPGFAREFLSDLATGKVSRGKGGRPPGRSGRIERSIVYDVFVEWEKVLQQPKLKSDGKRESEPKMRAIREVAERGRGKKKIFDSEPIVERIKGVMEKLRKQGITLKRWQAWGRPNWKK